MAESIPATSPAGDGDGVAAPTVPSNTVRTRNKSSTWLRSLSRSNLALLLLLYISTLHLVGLYIFTKGFLLTRLTIPHSSPSTSSPAIPATHSKAIVLVIDALRTDFISPHHPSPPSPYHHGILTLPAELSAERPEHSLIFNTFSDPPTSTMQRIKGLTTGSLPTFIDIGSNFASTAIEEDSLISQLVAANKTIGFMGDDTWVNLFPSSFDPSHPYDSFNVEDLHTVDNGVIEHLFPYLNHVNQSRWDVLIGHFLGVDHVGHRVTPNTETMRLKLEQMDDVLRKVVDLMDDDTLLVVLGDHGMDQKGNHGGDSDLETAAALWLYSKGHPLTHLTPQVDEYSRETYLFPGSSQPLRHINQIDLVPTLALLLGVSIPYNNLGSVIPECFAANLDTLELATRTNAEQISRYLESYGDQGIQGALRSVWSKASTAATTIPAIESASAVHLEDKVAASGGKVTDWLRARHKQQVEEVDKSLEDEERSQALQQSINAHRYYTLEALRHLRALWAQFSMPLIILGSLILCLSALTLIALYVGIRNNSVNWDVYARLALETAGMASAAVASVIGTAAGIYTREPAMALKTFFVVAIIVSEIVLIAPLFININLKTTMNSLSTFSINRFIGPMLLFIHAISFGSNSFIMWEDRLVLFLLVTIPLIYAIKAFSAPTATMRIKIFLLSITFALIARLMSISTICREEQQPYCRVTFYSGSTSFSPTWILIAIIPVGLQLPRAIGITLSQSKSLAGPAPLILGIIWRSTLVINGLYWILEWLESYDQLQPERIPLVSLTKIWIARVSIGMTIGALPYIWFTSPLCISVERQQQIDIPNPNSESQPKEVTVYGFANTYGSTYILFYLIPFTIVHLVLPPTGQLVLAGTLVALLLYLELVDTRRDALILQQSFASSSSSTGQPGGFDESSTEGILVRPSFTDIVPITLLGYLGFFATGHQSVISSIQWKSAFILTTTVSTISSPLLVFLNTWGAIFLSVITIPLLSIWNISPRPRSQIPLLVHTLQLLLAFLIYHTIITIASAITAAYLRRHLMVWKVFAPRFMLAGVTLLVVDLGALIALSVGFKITAWKVKRTFGCESV